MNCTECGDALAGHSPAQLERCRRAAMSRAAEEKAARRVSRAPSRPPRSG